MSSYYNTDDKNYRASTPLHWVQQQSIFRLDTQNERKNVFIMGTGLVSMWPNLFHTDFWVANALYWVAYPLGAVAVFLFTGLFTEIFLLRIFSVLLYVSAPIVIRYLSSSLVQESWLGLSLLSYAYFIIKILKYGKKERLYTFFAGISFGVVLFLKPSSWSYAITMFLFFLSPSLKKYFLMFITGTAVSVLLSGMLILNMQNMQRYGSPLGSKELQLLHVARISSDQIITHITRMPFVFIEFPTFSKHVANIYTSSFQKLAQYIGATKLLDGEWIEENPGNWLRSYTYHLSTPNSRFSVGGLLWLALFFIIPYGLFKEKGHSSSAKSIYTFIFLILAAVILQLIVIRWAEGADLPYRHLLSSFILVSGFFPLGIVFLSKFIPKWCSYLLLSLVLVASAQQFLSVIKDIDSLSYNDTQEYRVNQISNLSRPYADFLEHLTVPTSFLLVESGNAADYPLFGLLNQMHTVYLLDNKYKKKSQGYLRYIEEQVQTHNVEYVVFDESFLPDEIDSAKNLSNLSFFLDTSVKAAAIFIYRNNNYIPSASPPTRRAN